MKIFGYIPSRMGSKRLPGKDLKKIGKKTLQNICLFECFKV